MLWMFLRDTISDMQCAKCRFENIKENRFCSNCGGELYPVPFYKKHPLKFGFRIACFLILGLLVYSFATTFNEVNSGLESQSVYKESVISGSGDNRIAVISIDGVIVETSTSSGFGSLSDEMTSARDIKSLLESLKNQENLKAIVLRINSPGGSAAASEEILSEIRTFKSQKKIPVVAYFTDVAASGGYYVAMGADSIYANPATITGSIGVIMSYLNVKELADTYGVKHVVYKSGEYKNLADSFSEANETESAIIQSLVDETYKTFVDAVATGRNLDSQYVMSIADGRIYSANQAKDLKLIDHVGHFEDAISAAKERAGVSDAQVVEYGSSDFLSSLLQINLSRFLKLEDPLSRVKMLGSDTKPQLLYMTNL
jgi:protease IV